MNIYAFLDGASLWNCLGSSEGWENSKDWTHAVVTAAIIRTKKMWRRRLWRRWYCMYTSTHM